MKLFDLSQLRSVCFSSLPQGSGQQQPRLPAQPNGEPQVDRTGPFPDALRSQRTTGKQRPRGNGGWRAGVSGE